MNMLFRVAAVFFAVWSILNAVVFAVSGWPPYSGLTALGAGVLAVGAWRLRRGPSDTDSGRTRDLAGLSLVSAGGLMMGVAGFVGAPAAF